MSGLLRSVRPCVAMLLTAALVLGVNGFVGAIHSAHHLPAPVEVHEHDAHDQGHDRGHGRPDPAPAGAADESCPVAAAALHLSAAQVVALPVPVASSVDTELIAPEPQDAPRSTWTGPGSGRAPPFVRSLAS